MDDTPRLGLPFIVPGQALKHITHNEALERLDALVQPLVEAMDRTAPPAGPLAGEAYIVPAGAGGAWAGHGDEIAVFQSGAWRFFDPAAGWQVFDRASGTLRLYSGTAWIGVAAIGAGLDWFGVNSSADATNRLAVSAPATLLTHEGADHRLKVNKASDADTASLLFQSDWSGRAEIGLMGDGDWHIKVSPDGSTWTEAMVLDATSGDARFAGALHPALDNMQTLGGSGARWAAIWSATGTIQTSDRRDKAGLAPSDLGLDFILALAPMRFNWRDRPEDGTFYGFVAQDVADAAGRHGRPDFAGHVLADPADPTSRQALRYDNFIAPLVSAVQALATRLAALERDRPS